MSRAAVIQKRSVKLAGHKTSVSLEAPFWNALREIAEMEGLSLNALVERVDAARTADLEQKNLSSALRLYVLAQLRAKAGVLER